MIRLAVGKWLSGAKIPTVHTGQESGRRWGLVFFLKHWEVMDEQK